MLKKDKIIATIFLGSLALAFLFDIFLDLHDIKASLYTGYNPGSDVSEGNYVTKGVAFSLFIMVYSIWSWLIKMEEAQYKKIWSRQSLIYLCVFLGSLYMFIRCTISLVASITRIFG